MYRDGNNGIPVRAPDTRPGRNEGVMGKIVETTLDMKAMRSMDHLITWHRWTSLWTKQPS